MTNLTPEQERELKYHEEQNHIKREEETIRQLKVANDKAEAETEKLKAEANAAKAKSAADIAKLNAETQAAKELAEDNKATRARDALNAESVRESEKKTRDLTYKTAERADTILEQEKEADTTKRDADRQKAIAEAQKATRDAMFPRGTSAALEGTTVTDDKAGYMADLVAHKALETCAAGIAKEINADACKDKNILIVDSLNFSDGDLIRIQTTSQITAFDAALTALKPKLENLFTTPLPVPPVPVATATGGNGGGLAPMAAGVPPLAGAPAAPATAALLPALGAGALATIAGLSNPVTLGLTAAVSGVSLAADVGGYFLTDYNIKGRELAISTETVLASVAGALTTPKRQIFGFRRIMESTVMTDFSSVLKEQLRLAGHAERIRLKLEQTAKTKEALNEVTKAAAKLTKPEDAPEKEEWLAQAGQLRAELAILTPDIQDAEATYQTWKTVSAGLDTFAKHAVTVSTGARLSPIAMSALMESLEKPAVDYILWVKAGSAGSETMTQRSLFPWSNAKNTYFGGVTVSYVLADPTGIISHAGTKTAIRRLKYSLAGGRPHNSGEIDLNDVTPLLSRITGIFRRKGS